MPGFQPSPFFLRLRSSPCQPPKRNLGLGEVAERIRTVVMHLQWLFFASLCRLRIPRVRLHFLDCVRSCLTAKSCRALIQHHGSDSNTFVYIIICVHVPDAALRHLDLNDAADGSVITLASSWG